jgi:hypothetical protein
MALSPPKAQQGGAVSHPCCREGYNSLDAHPGNRDCLNATDAVDRGVCGDWQYGVH